ncbi:MAG: acid phosphatase, partial [Planctomycetaceae bacterium]|nr:acid phosphatase [Planctomycetaceae bacterium]
EDLPEPGFTGKSSQNYVRKHNPWVNFTDVPAQDNLPFTDFPSDFNQLPTVSIVVPNLVNDMHDGSVHQGDAWLQTHLDAYVQWAKTNNSLLVVTWDEDDFTRVNHIATLFVGPMVIPGQYSETINHFNVLRTLEDAYGLTYAGASASKAPITDIWNPAFIGPALTSSVDPSVFGQSVTFTVTVGPEFGTPSGTATFLDGTTTLGTVALTGGSASFSTETLEAGAHAMHVVFSADVGISTSPHLLQTVNKDDTNTTLAIVASPPGSGMVTFQATVSANSPGAGTPSETVTFKDRKKVLGTSTLDEFGQAALSIPAFKRGKHLITAFYVGNANFNPSKSAVLQVKPMP